MWLGGLSVVALGMAAALVGWTKPATSQTKPTIVLVHGAFAESSSWNAVIAELSRDGYHTIAAANPLRGVAGDAEAVASIVKSVSGPVVLVGHSYGGPAITEAANGNANVKALVYVAGFDQRTRLALAISSTQPSAAIRGSLA